MIGANDDAPGVANDTDLKRRQIADAVADAQEQERRLLMQGVDVRRVGAELIAKRVGGLEWLYRKGRIDLNQHRAGEQYGDDFSKADQPVIRSCLNDRIGGEPESMQERKQAAVARLTAARRFGLMSHEGMISLMDAVCGHGARLRSLVNGDDALAGKKEAELRIALDLLARHYGIL
jgi:hypothetical protein